MGVEAGELASLSDKGSVDEETALDMPEPAAISKSILVTDKVSWRRIRCDSIEPVLDSLWILRTVEADTRSSGCMRLYK